MVREKRQNRISKDECYLSLAHLIAERSTCSRRAVGCILVDKKGFIVGMGYNGVPSGVTHCIDDPCGGANSKSGEDLDLCIAIHAEQNALLHCVDTNRINIAYITISPCMTCAKLLLNTPCKQLIYSSVYSEPALGLWEKYRGKGSHKQKQYMKQSQ